MNMRNRVTTCGLAMSLAMFTSLGVAANAQDASKAGQQATVQGLVIGRDGSTMLVKTADTPRLNVVLSDSTKATQRGGGFLGLGRKDLGITELVPGLQVKVEGSYDPNHQLLARKVEFSRNSMTTARQIDAGLNPTNEKIAAAQDQLRSDRKDIEANQANIAKNTQDINTTQQGLAANVQATGENKQAIGQTNTRIGTLDQYETKDSLTVNFAHHTNNKAIVQGAFTPRTIALKAARQLKPTSPSGRLCRVRAPTRRRCS